jgi:DNA modification methylase
MAGEQLGRRVFAMEISPAYVDVAVKRWLAGGEGRRVLCNGDDVTEKFNSTTDGSD